MRNWAHNILLFLGTPMKELGDLRTSYYMGLDSPEKIMLASWSSLGQALRTSIEQNTDSKQIADSGTRRGSELSHIHPE